MIQKTIDEYLAGIAQADPVRRFVRRADQHQATGAVHDTSSLAVPVKPFSKRRVCIVRSAAQAVQSPGDAQFFAKAQVVRTQEAAGQVQWSGQPSGLEPADA